MATRSKTNAAIADEITAVEDLMADLEKRLRRLNGKAKKEVSGGASDVQQFVSTALAGIMGQVRNGASSASDSFVDEATRIGTDAVKKIAAEVDQRPLAMLAVAAGIGFLFGLSRR